MSVNLLETIQKNLGYPALQKIDPNTEEVKEDSTTPDEHRFSQAAIPTVLTGLYAYSAKDEGAQDIIGGDISSDWMSNIFGNAKDDIIEKVRAYSYQPVAGNTADKLNRIAAEAIKAVREELGPNAGIMDVKKLLSGQTTSMLAYLPKELHIGQMVNEETLDDNTNKMEGPISSLMHKIGAAFSNPSSEAEVNPDK